MRGWQPDMQRRARQGKWWMESTNPAGTSPDGDH